MGIFDKRVAFKPFEYPAVMGYIDAINNSYWTFKEWNYISDIQDYKVTLNDNERDITRKTLLAISQIEVSVKSFWGKLDQRFPKPEFNAVGATFSESEVRHERAYSHLLEVLGLNDEFEALLEVPVIQGRVDYLTKYVVGASKNSNQNYALSLALFSLFIENVSLFSQFAIIKTFNHERNVLKDIDNVIQATQREELIHGLLGTYLILEIKKENPDWFNDEFYAIIEQACHKAFEAEVKIIDWIFEGGELEYMPKESFVEFIKYRFNESLAGIGAKRPFVIDELKLGRLSWVIEEIHAQTHVDFFHKKSNAYAKKIKSITASDLF